MTLSSTPPPSVHHDFAAADYNGACVAGQLCCFVRQPDVAGELWGDGRCLAEGRGNGGRGGRTARAVPVGALTGRMGRTRFTTVSRMGRKRWKFGKRRGQDRSRWRRLRFLAEVRRGVATIRKRPLHHRRCRKARYGADLFGYPECRKSTTFDARLSEDEKGFLRFFSDGTEYFGAGHAPAPARGED